MPRRVSYERGYPSRGRYKYYSARTYNHQRSNAKSSSRCSHNKYHKKVPSRSPSPIEGSEEYMTRKIQHTSAIIMRHLLTPNETITSNTNFTNVEPSGPNEIAVTTANTDFSSAKLCDKSLNKAKKSNTMNLNAKEIHDKIMNHITNLNEGRKRNFINANNCTGLDNAINQMQKQKRLEISRILRDMNSSNLQDTEGYTNSMVPDIGIKIEDLPVDVIEELRQTLHLDLEFLNEALGDSSNLNNHSEVVPSRDPDIGIDSIKREQIDCGYNDPQNTECVEAVEIKSEDISDIFEESAPVELLTPCIPEEMTSENIPEREQNKDVDKDPMHHSVSIKEESEQIDIPISSGSHSICSDSTVIFQPNIHELAVSNRTIGNGEHPGSNPTGFGDGDRLGIQNDDVDKHSLTFIEATIRQFTEADKNLESIEVDTGLAQLDLLDLCIKHLTSYRRLVTRSIVTSCRRNSLNKNREGIGISEKTSNNKSLVTRASQTLSSTVIGEEDTRLIKKRKIESSEQSNRQDGLQPNNQIKTEETTDLLEVRDIVMFPKVQERIIAIERVDNEVLLATESGNIIFASLSDGTFQHSLDVTNCVITSMAFVRGLNDFIYMYVGSLEEVLRVYDFRKRSMMKASHIDDQIRCMDPMWDYVFMGCKNGTLIRYSCKKEKIEYEEKNTGTDILVLKAAQEGPRRVLLVGHRQAPIYVRDAMSGLYLRNFSNQAVAPTVYSIIINKNNLYCGTARDNILVFSFHEGHLIEKMIAGDSRGISCMKICKNLLFAGCYNGSIYIYNLELKKLVTVLNGPGGSIICMEVLDKQVIVGTLTSKFDSVILPSDIFIQQKC